MIKPLSLCYNPIFIIGNPRSGTTLLRLILTCHKSICIPPECSWLVFKYFTWKDFTYSPANIASFLEDLFTPATRKIETWNLDKQALDNYLNSLKPNTYQELSSAIYTYYMKKTGKEKVRWGDKNNVYLRHVTDLHTIFSEAQFVHIIRDPRGVVNSYKNLVQYKQSLPGNRYVPSLPSTAEEAAQHWLANIKEIEKQAAGLAKNNLITVRYEDLLLQPTKTMKFVCSSLGEHFHKSMLDFYTSTGQLEPQETIPWKIKTLSPIDPTNTIKWQAELSSTEVNTITHITKSYMDKYLYE